jgi:hypothetical protein
MVFVDMIKWFINNLSNPYFTAFFCGFLTFLLMYIDSKITRKEIHRRTYTKNVLLVMILTGTVVYILTNTAAHPKINKLVDESIKTMAGGATSTVYANYDTGDILLGDPTF